MTYQKLKHLKSSAFKRRCGVHPETFEQMVEVLRPHLDRSGRRGGQCKLSVEDQLLLVLEYWREYRTQFHIATTWGLSESAVCRLIRKVETQLMKSGKFLTLTFSMSRLCGPDTKRRLASYATNGDDNASG